MRNSAVKRAIAILLCLVVFAGSELTGVTNIVGDLFANEMSEGDSEGADLETASETVEVEAEEEAEEPSEVVEDSEPEDTVEENIEPAEEVTDDPEVEEVDTNEEENNAEVVDTDDSEVNTDSTDNAETDPTEDTDADVEDDGEVPAETDGEDNAETPVDSEDQTDLETPADQGDQTDAEVPADTEEGEEQKPEEEEEPEALDEEYKDGQVIIHVEAEPGVVPNGTRLSVKKIVQQDVEALDDEEEIKEAEELNAKYEDIQAELELSVADDDTKEIAAFVAYDVNFLLTDEDGETTEIEPDGEVSVSMEFEEAYLPEEIAEKEDQIDIESIDVIHMEEAEEDEESETGLKSEVVADADVSTTENAVEKAEFTTGSGKTFVITWTENDLGEREYVCETEDATITVTAAKGVVPDGALLQVVPILANNEATKKQYQDVEKKLLEKAESEAYEIAGFLAYDISFTDETGAKLEPNGEVKVAIDYKKAAIPEDLKDLDSATYALDDTEEAEEADTEAAPEKEAEETSENGDSQTGTAASTGSITVMHLEENDQGQVTKVVDMGAEGKVTELNSTKDQKVTSTEFVTESFSAFTIVWKTGSVNQSIEIGFYRFGEDSSDVTTDIPIENLILTVKDEDGSDKRLDTVTLNNKEYFDIGEISEEGKWKDYYYLKDEEGNLYKFDSAKAIMTYGTWLELRTLKSFGYEDNSFQFYNEGALWPEAFPGGWKVEIRFYYVPVKEFKTVDTIDNQDFGITMRMIDYVGHGPQAEVMGARSLFDRGTNIKYGMVEKRLGDDGYPVMLQGNKDNSLKVLFEQSGQSDIICEDANNLFLSDTYKTTGYLSYSSFENYAYFDQDTGNFKVYKGIGAPDGSDITVPEQNRGNFLPYNDVTGEYWPNNRNYFDINGNPLDPKDARYGELLYKPTLYEKDNVYENGRKEDWNKCFGMYIEAAFVQPKGGKVEFQKENGETTISDMIYEFNGDDDLWVFIDGTLILDIGGSHAARLGTINFATGEVIIIENGNENKKTIKGLFEELKIFPDGTTWDASKIDNYFRGNTFADNTQHRLKMFYMEHGGGASNLHIKMNLSTVKIPKGTIEVEKQLSNTDKAKYKDVSFAFQVWAQEITETSSDGNEIYGENFVTLTKEDLAEISSSIPFKDSVTIGETEYKNVFYLKPDEVARFEGLQNNRNYYVKELGINSEEYDRVVIKGTSIDGVEVEEGVENKEIQSTTTTVENRSRIVYANECSEENLNTLRITKKMPEGQTSEDTFTFKVSLGGKPYDGQYVLVKSDGTREENLQASSDGVISGVSVGDMVEIDQIMSDTTFKVEEVIPDTDENYTLVGITGKNGTYGEINSTNSDSKVLEGKILLGRDAEVTVTNALNNVQSSGLSITKRLKEGSPDTKDLFEFKVYQMVDGKFELYTGAYSIGTETKTATNGIISINANETALIEMEAGTQFKVEETLNEGYGTPEITATADTATDLKTDGNTVEGTISEGVYADVTVTNVPKYTWELVKQSSSGDQPLNKAEFELKSDNVIYFGLSGKEGIVKWYNEKPDPENAGPGIENFTQTLQAGTYTLTETKSPTGYEKVAGAWTITITDGKAPMIEGNEDAAKKALGTSETNGTVTTFYIKNDVVLYELPSTGGAGIFGYMISGVLLMIAGVLVLYKRKYAGRC